MQVAVLVEKYIALRDKKAQLDAAHKERTAELTALLDRIEGTLLSKFQELGVDSMKTENGTAYISSRSSASVADWDAILTHIRENEAWELLERRVSKTAVEQHKAQNDELPPGINWSETYTVNVRRS